MDPPRPTMARKQIACSAVGFSSLCLPALQKEASVSIYIWILLWKLIVGYFNAGVMVRI